MPTVNRLKRLLVAGDLAVGVSCRTGNVYATELIARSRIDYIYFDQQHGTQALDVLRRQLEAMSGTGPTPLVRVSANDAALIGMVLDMGAEGVIVPMIETAEQAAAAVAACRYPPKGSRSWGALRAEFGLGTVPTSVNEQVLCFLMVETLTGVANVEAMLALDGV